MRKYRVASGAALLVGSLAGALPAAAQTTVEVTPADPAGWTFYESNATGSSGITGSEPRAGDGSLELNTSDSSGRTRFGYGQVYSPFAPTIANLDEVTSLAFDWFRAAASNTSAWHAPVFRLHLWDGAQRSELVWEAVYNGYPTAGPAAPEGVWTTTDLMTSTFYRWVSGSGVTLNGGSQVNQSVASWASSPYYSSDARITGISVGSGSGWANGFTGYADNVVLGVNGQETTWNFNVNASPTTVTPEPVTMALLGSGLAGLGAVRRRRKKQSDVA